MFFFLDLSSVIKLTPKFSFEIFPMDLIWHILPSENHLPSERTQSKSPSGQSSHQARNDISGVVDYEIHFPFITFTLHRNLEVCTNCTQASTTAHWQLTGTQQGKTLPQSRRSFLSVYCFFQTSERGSVWLRALRMEPCWNVTHSSPEVTEALSVLCPMFNPSASFQAFITHRFLSAVPREDIQRPEPVPRLSLGPHQLRIGRAGPDLAGKLQRSLQGTEA